LSPVTYQLRLPVSYGMHPIINIVHLEKYTASPSNFGLHTTKAPMRDFFDNWPEVEVQEILEERLRKTKGGKKRIREYKVRFIGYRPEDDEWLTKQGLRNVPEILQKWQSSKNCIVNPKESRVD
ncbi:hypothetical protein CPB84DRAFT_1689434, partial [Gymnopilus junonius]